MKKVTFTKLIMLIVVGINVALLIFACVMMWRTGDLTPLGYMAIGDGGALGVCVTAYAWKEKAANRSKYAMEYVDKYAAEHGPETAIQVMEIVLRD